MKSVSRRNFLGSGIAEALAIAGIGLGVIGIASPGPSSPSLTGAFVNRFPADRAITTAQPKGQTNRFIDYTLADDNGFVIGGDHSNEWAFLVRFRGNVTPALAGKAFWGINDSGMLATNLALATAPWDPDSGAPVSSVGVVAIVPSTDFPGESALVFGTGIDDGRGGGTASWDWQKGVIVPPPPSTERNGTQRNVRISTQAFDAFNVDNIGRALFIDTGNADRLTWREHTTATNIRNALHTADFPYTAYPTTFGGIPAQVGLGTAATGTNATQISRTDHRHAFSGQFSVNGYLHAPVLAAGVPVLFQSFYVKNGFSVRRLTVRVLVAPVGGGETYAVTNAAGVVQGFTVTLAAGALVATATGINNLTANTEYVLAQTGSTAVTPSQNANMTLSHDMTV